MKVIALSPFRALGPAFAACTAGLLVLAGAPTCGAAASHPRPNVLFIAVDDLRPELGTYGASYIKSPHIDRLAARGVRFDRAYCQYAICGPSRASLLTGLRPDTLKIEDIDTFFRDTVPDVVTLPQHFRRHGYTTVYAGKVFHARQTDDANSWSRKPALPAAPPLAGGEYQLAASRALIAERRAAAQKKFGANADLAGIASGPVIEAADAPDDAYPDGRTTEAALATLREIKDQPFFLGVGYTKPHLSYVAPKKYFELYAPAQLPLATFGAPPAGGPAIARHSSFELRTRAGVPTAGQIDDAQTRALLHAYAACVSFVDAQVGRLLDELEALGLSEKTIVVLWGDHGWHLGELGMWGKATNYEAATRVPLIVHAPGRNARGAGARGLVEFIDIYPTLCELAGLPRPPHLEGVSFAALLDHADGPGKPAAFSQFPSPALREWAARPLSPGMRQTFFGPLIEQVEAQLAQEHGPRYERETFERHVMGYTLRMERHRFTAWLDRRDPAAEPLALELYEYGDDLVERENLAGRAELQALVRQLLAQLRGQLRS